MKKAQKLKNILKVLSPDETKIDFSNFDNEINKLKESLKEKIQVKTLEDVNTELEKSRKKINFEPLISSFADLKQNVSDNNAFLLSSLDEKLRQLSEAIKQNNEQDSIPLKQQIEGLISEVAILSQRKIEIPDFAKQIQDTEKKLLKIIEIAKANNDVQNELQNEALQKQFAAFEQAFKKLRIETLSRGGGSMNRKITFNGVDYLTRYTDINYKAGTNVTFTVVNNNQTKQVDVTVASSGGGGGSVRSINSVSTPTNAGSTAGTDYVYLVSGTTTITLPTAVGNSNLYTIKNVGTGIVTIATTSAQTIDGNATIQMATQFTSVDLISDTANWNIT